MNGNPASTAAVALATAVLVLSLCAGDVAAQENDGGEPGERPFDESRLILGHENYFDQLDDPETLSAAEFDKAQLWFGARRPAGDGMVYPLFEK